MYAFVPFLFLDSLLVASTFIPLLVLLLQLRPNFADAWSNLASAYMRKGRLTEAAQCCRQALAINPLMVILLFV
jgi:tetratricopeptide (TPR) repeat protein